MKRAATFPSDDIAFARYVQSIPPVESPAALQAALRPWYPNATVQVRDALAGFGPEQVWYVYRDGDALRRSGGTWWNEDDVARMEFGRDGVFLTANDAAEKLAGGALVGRPLEDVRPADVKADPDWLWQAIEQHGSVTSIGRLARLDGSECLIEFYAGHTGTAGRYVTCWRLLAPTGESELSTS